jgi:hypothetical protein
MSWETKDYDPRAIKDIALVLLSHYGDKTVSDAELAKTAEAMDFYGVQDLFEKNYASKGSSTMARFVRRMSSFKDDVSTREASKHLYQLAYRRFGRRRLFRTPDPMPRVVSSGGGGAASAASATGVTNTTAVTTGMADLSIANGTS